MKTARRARMKGMKKKLTMNEKKNRLANVNSGNGEW